MGGLFVSGNTFAEAVLLGVKKPEDYAVTQPNNTETEKNTAYTKEVKTTDDFIDYTTWTVTAHEGTYESVNKNDK